jgi:hypothetical protein
LLPLSRLGRPLPPNFSANSVTVTECRPLLAPRPRCVPCSSQYRLNICPHATGSRSLWTRFDSWCLPTRRPRLWGLRPLYSPNVGEKLSERGSSNAPTVNLAGIRITKWANSELFGARKATPRVPPSLFGQSRGRGVLGSPYARSRMASARYPQDRPDKPPGSGPGPYTLLHVWMAMQEG